MNRLEIVFHPSADEEAVAAYRWYAERSPTAAQRFRDELDVALARIQRAPQSGGNYLHGTRCYLLRRFPYLVVYRPTAGVIQIIAVAHGHRRPGYWKARQFGD